MGKRISVFTLSVLLVFLMTVGLWGCKAEEKPNEELVSALFTSMYTAEAKDIEAFGEFEADNEGLINALSQRFSGCFTPECFEGFLSNRDCQFFLDRVENGETSSVELEITAKNADGKDGSYSVSGTATYDKDAEEVSHSFSAEAHLLKQGDEMKIDSLIFAK